MITTRDLARVVILAIGFSVAADAGAQSPPAAKPSAAAAPPQYRPVVEPPAMELLKAMGAHLAAAKAMTFTAVVGYEYPSRLGPPIVYTTRYDVTMQRPDRLRVVMPGDGPASEFMLDGSRMIAFAPAENLAAIADAPPTIDAALLTAFNTASIYFPFTDLVLSDPSAIFMKNPKVAFVVGPSGVVGDVRTDMVVWGNDDVFLQVWIGTEDRLPRRVRAMFRGDRLGLRHDMELMNWRIDPVMPADAFATGKAEAAGRMAFAAPALPPGVRLLAGGKPSKPAAAAGKPPASTTK